MTFNHCYIYLDITPYLHPILTSIAVLKDHTYQFQRVYLSWQWIILSWHSSPFIYFDIQVLLSILTSITILKEHVYKFDGVYPSWHYNSFHLIFTSITVSRSMLLNVIWCIYLDIKPLLHLILTSIWYVYLDIQSLHVLSWHQQVKKTNRFILTFIIILCTLSTWICHAVLKQCPQWHMKEGPESNRWSV